MLTLYMVTINLGLVHLGSLIREYLCHFRLKLFAPQSGWVQLKFIFVAYEMSNTFLDHMQLDLGRYLLPFGRAHQMSQVSKSVHPHPPPLAPLRLYKSSAHTNIFF